MKILFIARAYPPIIGGIENQNFGIAQSLGKISAVKIIANRHGKGFLPLFLPYAAVAGIYSLFSRDAVVLGDGVLAPLGALFNLLFPKKKVLCIVHGLDITFAHQKHLLGWIYRAVNIPSLSRLTRLIMVGNQTIEEATALGVPRQKCTFVPNGVSLTDLRGNYTRDDLERVIKMPLDGRKVILRVGRYTRHKGTEWFIRSVMPKLPKSVLFVAAGGVPSSSAGDANAYPSCQRAITELRLENRVRLLTNLPQKNMNILLNTADLVVSPNIPTPGTMEGFGINAIEAAGCGRVVVASNLEGLKDAIQNGENGFLIEPGDASVWTEKIISLLNDDAYRGAFGAKAKTFVEKNFSWETIAKRYLKEIEHRE